jgi:hypothetical protein
MKYNLSEVGVLVISICLLFVGLHQCVDYAGLLWLAMVVVGSFGIGVFVCSGQEDTNA